MPASPLPSDNGSTEEEASTASDDLGVHGVPPTGLSHFLVELRRRKLGPFLIAYVAFSWGLLQLAEVVLPAFGLGDLTMRILVIAVVLFFPPATALAWLFDLTRHGIQRTDSTGGGSAWPRVALLVTTVVAALGVGMWMRANGLLNGSVEGDVDRVTAPVAYEPTVPITSVAVLPLRDNSEDASLAYLGAGLHDELIVHLGRVDGLRVVSRASVSRYAEGTHSAPEIGRELQVDALVEGAVNRSSVRFRVTLRLVHALSDTQIDVFTLDTASSDVLALQTHVANEVAQLVVKSIGNVGDVGEPTRLASVGRGFSTRTDPAAAEAYLRGLTEYATGTDEGLSQARVHFEEAVMIDSTFARAFAGLAASKLLVALAGGGPDSAEVRAIQSNAARALQLAPESEQGREVFSLVSRFVGLPADSPPLDSARAPGTLEQLDRGGAAVVLNLSSFDTAWVGGLTGLGRRLADGIAAVPSGLGRTTQPSVTSRDDVAGRQPRSDGDLRRVMRIRASGDFRAFADSLRALLSDGRVPPEVAWEMIARAEASGGNPDGVSQALLAWSESGVVRAPTPNEANRVADSIATEGLVAYWEWHLERLVEAETTGRRVSRTSLAAAHMGAGRNRAALDLLDEALARGEPELLSILTDPIWDPLRRDESFVTLARLARDLRFSRSLRLGQEGRAGQEGRTGQEMRPR